jgi:hypothetical protein
VTFKTDEDWKIYEDELKKTGLTIMDIEKWKELGKQLASGITGEEYIKKLDEYTRIKRLRTMARLNANIRILQSRRNIE